MRVDLPREPPDPPSPLTRPAPSRLPPVPPSRRPGPAVPRPSPAPAPRPPPARRTPAAVRRPAARRRLGGRPPGPPPEPAMDALFGSFWPEVGLPANVRAVLASLAVGLLAAIVLPFRDAGVGTVVVLLAAGGVVLGFSVNRRSPFTLACAGLCALLASVAMLRDADWIIALCLLAGAVRLRGRGRRTAARCRRSSSPASPGRWPASAACRGWVARPARSPATAAAPRALRTTVWSLLGIVVFGLLFASADAVFAQWAGAVVPDLTLDTFVLRGFLTVAVGGVVLAAAYLALNPPRVEPERAGRPARGAPLRVAGAGAAGRRRVPGVPRRAGHGRLRRPRLPRAHHRADLRRLRPRGLRPAHGGHRPHAARGVGRGPQGAPRDDGGTGPGCAARSGCCAP